MGKVPVKCRKCAAPCLNGCEAEQRTKRPVQTHADRSGKRGKIADTHRVSRHEPAAAAEPERCNSPTQTDDLRRLDWELQLDEEQQEFAKEAKKHVELLGNPKGRSRKYREVVQFLYLMYKLQVAHHSGALAAFSLRQAASSSRSTSHA